MSHIKLNNDHSAIAGILLAAGDSTRMGSPKALLSLGGANFIDTILNNMRRSGCQPVIAVLGKSVDNICDHSTVNQFQCLHNPNPDRGMLSSLQIAINSLPDSCRGFIFTLVDHPLVRPQTYTLLWQAGLRQPEAIIIPVYQGRRGHPVYFGRKYFRELLSAPLSSGARKVVHDHQNRVVHLPVEDRGVIIDIDTPDDYEKVIDRK